MNTTPKQRNESLQAYNALIEESRAYRNKHGKRMPAAKEATVIEKMDQFREAYFRSLPVATLSRCPFCDQPFECVFDPWGVDGLWWQTSELVVDLPEPSSCPHAQLLQGAMQLNGHPPAGGLNSSLVGPALPFAVPRLMEHQDVKLVVSGIKMTNGYLALPHVYFSQQPLPREVLIEPWREESYGWTDDKGQERWSYNTQPFEFDLSSYAEQNRLGWIEAVDVESSLSGGLTSPGFGPLSGFPYRDLEGTRERQKIAGTHISYEPIPAPM